MPSDGIPSQALPCPKNMASGERSRNTAQTPSKFKTFGITVTNYGDSLLFEYGDSLLFTFTAAALAARCLAPLAALGQVCGVPKGGRAGARASRSIPASRAGGRWWGPARTGSSSPRRSASREVLQNRGSARATALLLSTLILARELRPSARPWPVFGTAHQPRDHRIERDVTPPPTDAARPSPPRQSDPGTDGPPSGTER
jgi:hypothetical protein